MKTWIRTNWVVIVACLLLVGCSLLPAGVKVEACLDHPKYGQVCVAVIGKDLYLKYDLAFLPDGEKGNLLQWAKEKLGLK